MRALTVTARTVILLSIATLSLDAGLCHGVEPAREFLEALRERGYYETALDYLQQMQSSPIAPADFTDRIVYERGMTYLEAATKEEKWTIREQLLDRAQESFKEFLKGHEEHELADATARQLGTLLMERAALRVAKVQATASAAEKENLGAEASELYDRAREVFLQRLATMRQRLTEFPESIDPKEQAAMVAKRGQLRAEYVQTQLVAATVSYEKAALVKQDEASYQKLLQQAADEYGQIAEKYRSWLAGLYSVLYRGRCYQDMGNYQEALSFYDELLQQSDTSDEFRRLRTKVIQHAMECWMHETVGQLDKAIETGTDWIAQIRQNEQSGADWLAVRWLLAQALTRKADSAAETKTEKNRLVGAARQQAQAVARHPGQYSREAKELLARSHTTDAANGGPEPTTFAEAQKAAQDSLQRLDEANVLIQVVQSRLSQTNDAERKKEMQQQIADAEQSIQTSRSAALKFCRLARDLAGESVALDELNSIRFFLCYLYYTNGEFYKSAVLGEFLARRYPDMDRAKDAGQIALASYFKLYSDAAETDNQFEFRRITDIADYIARRWADHPEAADALVTLVNLMIQQGELDQAETYLTDIAPDSRGRGQAQLRLGQAMWAKYLDEKRKQGETGDGSATDDKLDQMKSKAEKILADGIQQARNGEADRDSLRAVLSLAQIYLDSGKPAEAMELLDDPQIGPRVLTDQKDPRTTDAAFAEATYRLALRASIAALPNSEDSEVAISKAMEIMNSLKKAVGGSPQSAERLVSIYISVARDLQEQMENSSLDARQSLAIGFETFLSQLAEDTTELNVLHWVAEAFFGLASTMDDGDGELSSQAQQYYEKAAATYQKIMERGKDGDLTIDEKMLTQLQMRLAMTWQRLGDYSAAVDLFESILSSNNLRLNVQIEAARTLQAWAKSGKPEYYNKSILGDRINKKTRQNAIWGWSKLAKIAHRQMQRGPEYRERYSGVFHDARLNMAVVFYQKAMVQKGQEKAKALRQAKTAIASTYTLYPEMGGPGRKQQYDALLKKVQKGLGERNGGLRSLDVSPQSARKKPA